MIPFGLRGEEAVLADGDRVSAESVAGDVGNEATGSSRSSFALLEKLRSSGMTGLALLAVSVVGFSFAFERLFGLRRSLIVPEGLADQADALWKSGDDAGLRQLVSGHPSSLGRAILTILEHKNGTRAEVSTIAGDQASREIRHHLLRAYPLAVVATISPLLGLFGTVYGMIGAFESVALAGEMGDPSIMAGDISYALITTALGLLIAMPALAAYHFFRIRTRMFSFALEEQLTDLISRWFGTDAKSSATDGSTD